MTMEMDAPMRPPWRPAPVVAGTVGVHCVAGLAAVLVPDAALWALGTIAGNHALLTAAGLWPRSTWLGPNVSRLPARSAERREVALTFDDGPDPEVTPRILDLLESRAARATFFCVGDRAAAHRGLVREIARRGHGIENHSWRHKRTFPMHSVSGFCAEISVAQAILADAAGRAPRFFRAPAGLRNPLLDPALHRLGLTLVSWTRRGFDTRDGDASAIAARLLRGLAAGDILLLHDAGAARTASRAPVSLEVLPRLLDATEAAGFRCVPLHEAVPA